MITIQVRTHEDRLLQIDTPNEGLARAWLFEMVMGEGLRGLEVTRATVDVRSVPSFSDATGGSQPQRMLP